MLLRFYPFFSLFPWLTRHITSILWREKNKIFATSFGLMNEREEDDVWISCELTLADKWWLTSGSSLHPPPPTKIWLWFKEQKKRTLAHLLMLQLKSKRKNQTTKSKSYTTILQPLKNHPLILDRPLLWLLFFFFLQSSSGLHVE